MAVVYEKKVDNKMVLAVDEEKLINQIKDVCAKVEKAQDGYKKIMEQTYLLHKYKVHKKYNMSFYDFMRQSTGMGTTTCITLVGIWKTRVKLLSEIGDDAGAADVIAALFRDASMRQLIWLWRNLDATRGFIDMQDGNVDGVIDRLAAYIKAEESVDLIEDKLEDNAVEGTVVENDAEEEKVAENDATTAFAESYTINSNYDIENVVERIKDVLVKYHTLVLDIHL